MRAKGLVGGLLRGVGRSAEVALAVGAMALLIVLCATGWDWLMDATDQLGTDPGRDRLYRPGAAPKPADFSAFAPEERFLTNSLGMRLALLPPGQFIMGSPSDEAGHGADELPHRVRVTRPFYLGVYEVTVGQFRRFVEETGYRAYERECRDIDRVAFDLAKPAHGSTYSWRDPGFPQGDDHPVVNVSWRDATEFCRWLSRKEAREYRLPTEAEWEYACRAGSTQPYSMARTSAECSFPANLAGVQLDQDCVRFSWDDGFDYTAPVGSFPPNPWGLYDMHGNVCEHCLDYYGRRYYHESPQSDPQGPRSGLMRVIRGGGWFTRLINARTATRSFGYELTGFPYVGFRVARNYARAP